MERDFLFVLSQVPAVSAYSAAKIVIRQRGRHRDKRERQPELLMHQPAEGFITAIRSPHRQGRAVVHFVLKLCPPIRSMAASRASLLSETVLSLKKSPEEGGQARAPLFLHADVFIASHRISSFYASVLAL